jgi:YD repeat-containing protein
LDTQVTHITPAGGTAVDSRGHIELIFPPGAVPYPIDVIATQYDKGKELPTPLPELSVFTYAVELEPHGVVFNDSVTMRIANTLVFDPGTPIPIGFYNTATAQWEDVGMGYVTPDGEWSEYKIKRFSGYDFNLAIWWLMPDTTPQIKYNVTSPQNKEIDLHCSTPIGRKTGTLWINHGLPQFRTMGVSQAPRFVYNSSTTHPNPIIETYSTVDSATMNRPYSVQWRLKIEGHESSTHFVGGYGSSQQAILISAKNFRGDTLETGSYAYAVEIANCYNGRMYSETPCFGCIPTRQTDVTIPFPVYKYTTISGGQVVINNRVKSPFGVGWGLAELQRLHFNPDGSITLEEGDGTLLTYTMEGLGNYLPPEGEYSQLSENEDGSFTRRFRDGTKINFDDRGFMTSVVDRNQNTTNYNYNEDDLLVSIVSPVGQITQFVYDDSNYLDKVIDPAGRVADFSINSEGDRIEIMNPDSTVTDYVYSDHLLTRLINTKGDTTKYSYNEFYRLTEVEEPGGACCKSG